MNTRPLTQDDLPALHALLMREPTHNLFHLSGLREHGLAESIVVPQGLPWAVGAFRDGILTGAVVAFRGTGGVYHTPGDDETLDALADLVRERALAGSLSLLSGHASQIGPLLFLVSDAGVGAVDTCDFRTLQPQGRGKQRPYIPPPNVHGFGPPRQATNHDLDSLIDFYELGFYSLAHLPTRAAWRNRLSEQLAFRTLFIVEDAEGNVASAALASAETADAAMLGGVATREKYRGMGLSELCVGALCERLFQAGAASIALFYLKDNIPAAKVYDKLGFAHAGEWLLAPLGMGASFGPLLGFQTR